MYRAYADDPQSRVNLGIRRRLAPLLRDNRRKMELMNALLLSLPGTPIIYYGDEIRMGDNIYLGDRDGVRTPMQWNDDRNAGFSRANPQRLFLPVIIDAPYHYASRNVEVEQGRPHSMLWWMRRIIGLRKQQAAFGRGSIEFLTSSNPKVLAYLRQHEDETLLVVANLSRYVQCAELDLARFRGQTPVELFGQTRFPPIGELPYFLTLGPYAFYWFRLEWGTDDSEPPSTDLPICDLSGRWDALFEGHALRRLEAAVPAYLKRYRWFAGKGRPMQRVELLDVLTIRDVPEITSETKRAIRHPADGLPATRILLVRVEYVEGEPETYVLPVVFAQGSQEANILGDRPGAGILALTRSDGVDPATLCDTVYENEFWVLLFDAIARGRRIPGRCGSVEPFHTNVLSRLGKDISFEASVHGGEQSNTSAVLGGRLILKMFRRLSEGENPDLEIGRFLTEQTRLACVPQVAGGLEYRDHQGRVFTLAVMHEHVPNQGDAWVYTLDELGRYLERIESELSGAPPATPCPPELRCLSWQNRSPPQRPRKSSAPISRQRNCSALERPTCTWPWQPVPKRVLFPNRLQSFTSAVCTNRCGRRPASRWGGCGGCSRNCRSPQRAQPNVCWGSKTRCSHAFVTWRNNASRPPARGAMGIFIWARSCLPARILSSLILKANPNVRSVSGGSKNRRCEMWRACSAPFITLPTHRSLVSNGNRGCLPPAAATLRRG